MSIFFEVKNIKSIKNITKKNCEIIRKAISKFVKQKIQIKKPNDLLINKRKICGILQETIFFNENKFLIVGIGINLVKNPFISDYPTTNLLKETGLKIKNEKIVNIIKKNYEKSLIYPKRDLTNIRSCFFGGKSPCGVSKDDSGLLKINKI